MLKVRVKEFSQKRKSDRKPWGCLEDQFSSVAQSCPTLTEPKDCSTPGFLVHHQLLELVQTHVCQVSDATILCHPLLLPPSIFPSIRVFSSESVLCIRWPKYWNFSFSISPPNEYSGLISFRMDWLDLLAVQGTLKSLLQHHSSKLSVIQCSAFFIAQIAHPYLTPGKTTALTRQIFVDKVMSLLFNIMSRFVIAFLLRNKHLLITRLQLLQSSAVISSQIKKIYMQDSTFQLVGKRRISSFKLFVQTCGLNDFSLEFIKREVTLAISFQGLFQTFC